MKRTKRNLIKTSLQTPKAKGNANKANTIANVVTSKNIIIKDSKFLNILKNTIQDFLNVRNYEISNNLSVIYKTKELTLNNIRTLVEMIVLREENLDSIKLKQDSKIYDKLNEEHLYMKSYLSEYFSFSRLPNSEFIAIIRKSTVSASSAVTV